MTVEASICVDPIVLHYGTLAERDMKDTAKDVFGQASKLFLAMFDGTIDSCDLLDRNLREEYGDVNDTFYNFYLKNPELQFFLQYINTDNNPTQGYYEAYMIIDNILLASQVISLG